MLEKMASILGDAGIGTARLDTLVLLEDATGKDRAYLLAHPETTIQGGTLEVLEKQIKQRKKHIPLAQIRGKTEFYGREFIINEHVLEPRPESETMIELLKQLINSKQLTADSLQIADMGTGSGALGITAKLEIPEAEVILTDVDPACLKIARQNAKKYKVNAKVLCGNLLEPLLTVDCQLSAVLANLPYVPDAYEINRAALNEPKIAIFGGKDGLDLYRKLFLQIAKNLQFISIKYVFTESLPFQHKKLTKIAQKAGYSQVDEEDFIQVFEKL